jgi:hypothetical protein
VFILRQIAPGTPRFADSLSLLAYCLILQGKTDDEPESVLQESLEGYRATVGEDSISYHMTLGLHGLLHFEQGDYPTAERNLREAIDYVRPLAPETNNEMAGGMVVLGQTLTREGKAAEGEWWIRQTLELGKTYRFAGLASPEYTETALIECFLTQKHFAEAEPLLLGKYQQLKTNLGENDQRTAAYARQLLNLYTNWHKPAEAARFAVQKNPPANP